MKKLVFGLILLGLTNLVQAQNNSLAAVFKTEKPAIYTTKAMPIKNATYLAYTALYQPAKHIVMLHKKVAEFNIKALDIYTPKHTITYDVVFKEGTNVIKATYNHDGDVISCTESFEAVRLPYNVSSQLSKDYPKWLFSNTWCTINYSENNSAEVVYSVLLKKGTKSKKVTINP
ncbi:hypothetical protein QLS71_016040 [Mariniflexile litorale]|uniref:Uncharacterized protein n=1 Tax=Mariniflexile litorale TaxID=3045158 RepID=A0AAU7EFK5_9FLAO|nr:hypothetical protein [Mariniflexile sp. KMM 9835]MDQ8212344.1 hypothetical protein [Mariniflexile sp. KMM 9835]